MPESIWIGFDQREGAAFAVARNSIERQLSKDIPVHGLVLSDLQAKGLYTRPIEYRPSAVDRPIMWDVISDSPQSTEHANLRFLVPHLAGQGWAMFIDGDVLVRCDLAPLFETLDPKYALYCVKHNYDPTNTVKMDGQVQSRYSRKNQSSVMIFNCDSPANKVLSPRVVNSLPGRDLHRFFWLDDSEIGELGVEWNWLVGISDPAIDPKVCHFTNGTPDMRGYEKVPFADEWQAELARWAMSLPA